jgi:hypothetical protein
MLAMLHNTKGRNMENVVAHAEPSYSRPKGDIPQGIPQGVAFNDNSPNNSGFNNGPPSFFARLFGAPPPPPSQQSLDRRRRFFSR